MARRYYQSAHLKNASLRTLRNTIAKPSNSSQAAIALAIQLNSQPRSEELMNGVPAYELDFYAWTQQQAKLLQEEKWSCIDIPNLVEEIESLGRQERQELENRLGVLLGHLLKWEFQPDNRSRSWFATIREQRRRIMRLLEKSPSLQPYLPEALENGYQDALDLAVRETSLSYTTFPPECPYLKEQILDGSFLPGQTLESDEYHR